ncbi:hypothetical protein J2Z50_000048 [Ensifer mexicanus]|nr:hypothetical protein [Sinorhizobium mexicanum]
MTLRALFSRFFERYLAAFEGGETKKHFTVALGGGCLMVWPDGSDADKKYGERRLQSASGRRDSWTR